jgi:nucleotide-binding universal stress UspA family protein
VIRDIIVNLGLGQRDPAGEVALSLAEAFGAHVFGLAFAYDPVIPGALMGGIPAEWIETQRIDSAAKANAAIARFEERARRSATSCEHRLMNASLSSASDALSRMARCFDMVVVGQVNRDNPVPEEIVDEIALFESARPVIVVPFVHKGGLAMGQIMVCWDGSRAAARAVADALPILKKAQQVEVVIVAHARAQGDEMPGADLGQHLARHGLTVDVKRITSPEIDVASTILSHAADTSADLIVMGGYGHSRLREFVLGGVTRGILQSMTVPVLMSH